MWSIRTYFDYTFSESESRFAAECAQGGYIEILEFIQDSNHARGTRKLNSADVMRSWKRLQKKVPDLAGA